MPDGQILRSHPLEQVSGHIEKYHRNPALKDDDAQAYFASSPVLK